METGLQRRAYPASRNWAAMDTDILCSIFTRLPYVDLLRVNSTCWGWNAAIDVFKSCSPAVESSFQEIPWLIFTPPEKNEVVAGGEKVGQFVNIDENRVYPFNNLAVKKMKGGYCYCIGSSRDWLVCLDKQAIPYLLNPFTSHRIDLPRFDLSLGVEKVYGACAIKTLPSKDRNINCVLIDDFVCKAALSSSPSPDNNYYYLVMIYGLARSLAFCKDGDSSWTKLDGEDYKDIIFHENQLHAFYSCGFPKYNQLIVWDINQNGFNLVKKIDIMNEELNSGLQLSWPSVAQFYLVESNGNLLIVKRFSKTKRFSRYEEGHTNNWETEFKIFKLDMKQNLWRGVETLSEFSLFLGRNQSISVNIKNCKILKQDSIYFTDDLRHLPGVFSLKDNRVDWLDGTKRENGRSAPTWIVPRLK